MSASVKLASLKQNRDALLRAEIAALLHDVGKLTDLHIESHAPNGSRKWSNRYAYKVVVNNPAALIKLSKNAANLKKPDVLNEVLSARRPKAANFLPRALKRDLRDPSLRVSFSSVPNLARQAYTLAELIMLGTPGFAADKNRAQFLQGKDGWLPALLGVCHSVAHVDKEEPMKGNQSLPNVLTSTAFGYERQMFIIGDPQNKLDAAAAQLSIDKTDLGSTRRRILSTLKRGLGDTRRPINEVTLADWASAVAALFKSALAYAVLTNSTPGIRQWLSWPNKIIDHDIRWRLLRVNVDVLALFAKAVRIPDLLGYQRAVDNAFDAVKRLVEEEYPLGNEVYRDTTGIYFSFPEIDLPIRLLAKIHRCFKAEVPEIIPRVAVTVGDGASAQDQLKTILGKARREAKEELQRPFVTKELARKLQNDWQAAKGAELCPVCRLRPKLPDVDACEVCNERRARRAKHWAAMLSYNVTIWLDEVADEYGRVALIAGAFGLDDWLSGELVQTLLVKADPANHAFVPKNPSPARLRRIWETTQRFWQTALNEVQSLIQKPCGRLRLTPQTMPTEVKNFHTYDLVVAGRRVGVFRDEGQFITCDNLDYFAKVAQVPLQQALQLGQSYELWTPIGYGERTERIASITLPSVQPDKVSYSPVLSILSDPQMFMVVVPARHALAAIKAIKAKYEREMGKVRNRLPLTLGVVYFGRRAPLAAAIETARRMLDRPARSEAWEVRAKQNCGEINGAPGAICLMLSRGDRAVTLSVPTLMGDNATPDDWYPYWRVEGKPTDRKRCFVGPDNEHWVHVAELRPGDCVGFAPSTFDYEFLDTTARRFEVLYDQDGARRSAERRHRPYLIEELDLLEAVWGQLTASLSATQIVQLASLIEAKRKAWGESRGTTVVRPVFRRFVRDALLEAGAYSETLADAAVRGWLADLIELHCTLQNETGAIQQSETT